MEIFWNVALIFGGTFVGVVALVSACLCIGAWLDNL